MIEFIIHILITAVLLVIVAKIVSGVEVSRDWGAAIFAALVLGIVNAVVKPILIILTIPITILTLGLFLLVINALMLWLVSGIVRGVKVEGFGYALVGSIVLSILNALVGILL